MNELLDPAVAERILARALANGGRFAEVFAERRNGMSMSIDESRVESVQSGAEEGAGVRVVEGGTTYFAHVDGLDPADLERAADEAAAALKAERREPRPLEAVETTPEAIERRPEDVPAERKAELLRELDERGRGRGAEVAQLTASYAEARRRISVANSSGQKTTEFYNDERISVELEYELQEAVADNHVYVLLERADGLLVLRSADDDYRPRAADTRGLHQPGTYTRRVFFPPSLLNEGVYQFTIILGKRWGELDRQKSAFFRVEDRTDYRDASLGKRKGVVLFALEWDEQCWSPEGGKVQLATVAPLLAQVAPER